MADDKHDEQRLLGDDDATPRASIDSTSSASTTSLVLDRIGEKVAQDEAAAGRRRSIPENNSFDRMLPNGQPKYADEPDELLSPRSNSAREDFDLEPATSKGGKGLDRRFVRVLWIVGGIIAGAWILALIFLLGQKAYSRHDAPHDPAATVTKANGRQITLDQVLGREWAPRHQDIGWIPGANGEDGLLLERGSLGKDYLIVEDVRSRDDNTAGALSSTTLMQQPFIEWEGIRMYPTTVWTSKDLKKVLCSTDHQKNWRHSFYARYWIFDVASQTAEPLDHDNVDGRVQLATWSPQSDAVAFTRDNNLFLRELSSKKVTQITTDGGTEYFYGIPDWVYEEEVISGNRATWFSEDGKYIAFLRTNESKVPEYPVQYFLSRPSGVDPPPGEENYPEVRQIKYPKAGAPNPVVDLMFYDVSKGDVFEVKVEGGFEDHSRLITKVVWAGSTGKVLIRETNRESDILRVVLVDVLARTGKTVRTENVLELDGGWFEVTQNTRFIPADPKNGRPEDGYIDTIIHDGNDHMGYFTPLHNPDPIYLTSGKWEVVNAPSAIDLKKNLVYFVSTKEGAIQRHVYSVGLDGKNMKPLTDTSKEGYYSASFSSGAGYVLLNYDGPGIPWQKVISTPSNDNHYENTIGDNKDLADLASKHELPLLVYWTVNIDGFELNVMERRPPHFNKNKKYPVLFFLYGGPVSQQVDKSFKVDFQSYVAANLGYVVVTVDGRGTGYMGRKTRCIIRDNIGYYESRDQIETAKIWAAKPYVDASRLAIWGWSYGGFLTLKTLEQDAGRTFHYGMAVAPVTDWRFYDSIYTERYMHTPQHNPGGYENATINNVTALSENVRFLVMHGIADDNVHMQSTLTLLDKLDLERVENYDVHVFPDSDHSIYFHNANRVVYDKLSNWLINAFNGEWLKTANARPIEIDSAARIKKRNLMIEEEIANGFGTV